MRFAFHEALERDELRPFAEGLEATLRRHGHARAGEPEEAGLVIHGFDADEPTSFRRRSRSVFLVGLTLTGPISEPPLERGYPLLVRSLSNLLVGLTDAGARPRAHFFTPERGHYEVAGDGVGGADYFESVYRRIEPLATATLVVDNVFDPDLPPELRDGDETTEALCRAGERLGQLDLLPAPFPLQEVLPPAELRHLRKLFGIGGLSYGNLSVRAGADRFWMSASGVDKSRLREVGRDVLLVKGYDPERNAMLLSVPPDVEPRRVSVDAIEHWTLYREHPEVGAIVHVHAWMDGVQVTDFNFPCGTRELADAVAERVRRAPDPSRAVVGLKNHGLTITGRSLEGIFERIEGRIVPQVPME